MPEFSQIPTSILLATDLSSRCDRALERAVQLAHQWDAKLHIVHSLTRSSEGSLPASMWESPWLGSNALMEKAKQRLRNDLGPVLESLQPEIHIHRGDPGYVILDTAEKHECDMVVVGVARDEALGRRILGDTVDFLARKASVPILVVRLRAHAPYSRVVAATDFSAASGLAVRTALALFPDTRATLLHAYHIPFSGILMNDEIRTEFQQLGEKAATEFLQSQGLPDDFPRIVEQGEPEEVIKRNLDADDALIVIGSHGVSALSNVLLGTTARRILDRADTDVLLVPTLKRHAVATDGG